MKSTNLNKATLRKADGVVAEQRVYFHIYNRGVNGQEIFTSDDNYSFLTRRMLEFSRQLNISVIAYCLMPNHYHVLVEVETRKQASRFVQNLFNSYSQAFNQQQNRTGTLFIGRAKFKLIETDEYALQLCSYIHLNPVRAGLVDRPEKWRYSDYIAWISGKGYDNTGIRFFDSPEQYEDYVDSNLAKG